MLCHQSTSLLSAYAVKTIVSYSYPLGHSTSSQHHITSTPVFSSCTPLPNVYFAPNSISLFSSFYTNSPLSSAPATTTLTPSLFTTYIALLQHIISIANN